MCFTTVVSLVRTKLSQISVQHLGHEGPNSCSELEDTLDIAGLTPFMTDNHSGFHTYFTSLAFVPWEETHADSKRLESQTNLLYGNFAIQINPHSVDSLKRKYNDTSDFNGTCKTHRKCNLSCLIK